MVSLSRLLGGCPSSRRSASATFTMLLGIFCMLFVGTFAICSRAAGPFFKRIDSSHVQIGNDLWNITIGPQFGKQLYFKGKELIGSASGHYVSYNGAAANLTWTNVFIFKQTSSFIDVIFQAKEGDMHWVIFADTAGAYQYFVNKALPTMGEFRTLIRLEPKIFTSGRTSIKQGLLPTLAEIQAATKVQDETWQKSDGTYITKYDWTAFVRDQDFYGVYGNGVGSWDIHPSKDYYNGDQLKQELMVHRESTSGDTVQLNMLHGTHFQASSNDAIPAGKTWGPWLYYLNDGTIADAAARAAKEQAAWPYAWFNYDTAYNSRGSVSGTLRLSDGRPAALASVHLGDNNPTKTTLDMGTGYYYTTTTDNSGSFTIPNVRTGAYALQAWPKDGSPIDDVSTTFKKNGVTVSKGATTALGSLTWATTGKTAIFQVGGMDRKSIGFKYGGAPHQHALIAKCPASLTYTVGVSTDADWCFGTAALGTWSINFSVASLPANSAATLIVSIAGQSSGSSINVLLNGANIGNLGGVPNDPCTYRSGTTAGEWHLLTFPVSAGHIKKGANTLQFQVTRATQWHGYMWDSIKLEWA